MKPGVRVTLTVIYLFLVLVFIASCTLIQSKSVPEGFAYVKGGAFTMGDVYEAEWPGKSPAHQVTLKYNYMIGKCEVTFEQSDLFCDDMDRLKPWDAGWGRDQKPVINVDWWGAIAYCNWLSIREGLPVAYRLKDEAAEGHLLDKDGEITTDITKVVGYRLPTEAEWEYAARGGKHNSPFIYSGSDDVNEVAWYMDNSGSVTRQVGHKTPNRLGIHDMSGNVWEWCTDRWYDYSEVSRTNPYISSGSYRVIRGGSACNIAGALRVTIRFWEIPSTSGSYTGFRIARTIQ